MAHTKAGCGGACLQSSAQEAEKGGQIFCELEASLVYVVSSNIARTMETLFSEGGGGSLSPSPRLGSCTVKAW